MSAKTFTTGDVLTAADMNRVGADTDWIVIDTYVNGYSAASPTPAYRRIGSIVYLSGQLYRATAPNLETAFTIPAGLRPRGNVQATTVLDWQQVVQINTGGQVQIKSNTIRTTTTGYILDGISYPID